MIYNESKFNTEWDTLPLSKLGEFKRGKSKHRPRNDQKLFEGGVYPLIQTGEIKAANLLIKSHNAAYNDEGLEQSKIWPAGTLAITIAANIAETGILAYPMCFPDSCVGFNADKEKTSELFMHYVFTYIKRSIQNSAVGSIQDNINIEMLTALNFKIPKKPIQDLIVDLLSAIDYKIELNNDINTELENLAKTIYNYWFVQFDFPNEEGKPYKTSGGEMEWNEELKREIPKGWEVNKLGNYCDLIRGVTYNNDDRLEKLTEDSIAILRATNIQSGVIDLDNMIIVPSKLVSDEQKLKKYDILITMSSGSKAHVGKNAFYFYDDEVSFGAFCSKISAKEKMKLFVFCFMQSSEFKNYINKISLGTNINNLTNELVNDSAIIIPKPELIKMFEDKVKSVYERIGINLQQNQELIHLRDFLLPLLMNGQVKIKSEAKEQLSMAAEPQVKYGK
ncbi:MAG: restriction endonuclease subunit S [Chitinophagales bacterium]|nr:restriction endonuclease subunit S [Chitinophagales bacterium]